MKVRDLIKLLKNVDPDLRVSMTMNREYESPIGAIYVRKNDTLVIDDVPLDEDDNPWAPYQFKLVYSEFVNEEV